MDIHTCRNCERVDEAVSKKLKWFELLSAENMSLHTALTSARQQNEALLKKIANLHAMSINDRNEIVKLYVETEANKKLQPSTSKDAEVTQPKDEEDNTEKNSTECQKKMHEDEISMMMNEKEDMLKEFDKQRNKLHNHVKILLEELEWCRQQLFRQVRENLVEKHMFRDAINDLTLESKKAVDQMCSENMHETYDKAKNKMETILQSKNEQLKKQDDLISVLRQQQDTVNVQIEDAMKNKNAKIVKIRADYKRLQHRYYSLERRRRLDAEGFHTEVKMLRNDLRKLSKTSISKETAQVYDKKLHELDHSITYLYTN